MCDTIIAEWKEKKIIASEKHLSSNYIFARLNYFNKKQLFLYANR